MIERAWYGAPEGWGAVHYEGERVVEIELPKRRAVPAKRGQRPPAPVARLLDDLTGYFGGRRASVTLPPGLRLDWDAVGDFRRSVYREILTIPPGETRSYGEVARAVGRPRAARAVGTAMATNPFAPVVPCHRVVRSDGSIGGYGGGVPLKRRMLAIERGSSERSA